MRLKKNRRQKTISFFLIVILIGLFYLLIRSGLFTIKSVDINVEKVGCADNLQIKNSANILGQNYFLVNSDFTQNSLKEKFICIKKINLSKVFPNKVKLEILGRQPVAILTTLKETQATASPSLENIATPSAAVSQDAYLIDEQGVIFAKDLGELTLPKIYLNNSNISLGKKIDDLPVSLEILEKVKTFGLNVLSAAVVDKFFVIFPTEISKIIFRLERDVDTQIASLQLILEQAKIDAAELEFIDLRFDKPIVRFAPKKKA